MSATGVGAYDLQAMPVALLRNLATSHTASQVIVTFTVQHPGGSHVLAAPAVYLAPGETLAVAALCTDVCDGATSTSATVQVGGWEAAQPAQLPAAPAAFTCGSPCAGNAGGFQGDAVATLAGSVTPGALTNLFASCTSTSGTIVGGGLTTLIWGGAGSPAAAPAPPQRVSVPVLTTAQPSACQVDGSVAG